MNGATLRWALAAPVSLYVFAVVLGTHTAWTPTSVATLVVLTLPLGVLVTDRLGDWWFVPPALLLAGFLALVGISGGVGDGLGPQVLLGVLAGAPILVIASYGRVRVSSTASLGALLAGLAVDAVVLAVQRGLPTAPATGLAADAWSNVLFQLVGQQAVSLRALAIGQSIPPAPFGATGDAVFDALAVLGLFGLLASWLDGAARSTASPSLARGATGRGSDRIPLFPPPSVGRSGARSLVVAVGAVLVFEVAGALSPADAVLGVAALAPIVVGAVVLLSRERGRHAASPLQ
ncbi:MAG: hypothetical protein L3K17_03900 [Thermoplasmata archaeon]|nr:hypothetical protein [Thermoplasmata archaeon]